MQPCASFPVLLRGNAVMLSQYPAVGMFVAWGFVPFLSEFTDHDSRR